MRLCVVALGTLVALATTGCVDRPAVSPTPALSSNARLLPARVRRLTNLELERTVSALVGRPVDLAARLPPDARQEGFSPNADQGAPAQWATRYQALAREIAEKTSRAELARVVPCAAHADARNPGCARDLVQSLGKRAFRRPLDEAERRALMATFEVGEKEVGGFVAGATLVLRALIESPNLAYLTELGARDRAEGRVTLTPWEIASLLAYTVRGAPPDDELLRAAEDGSLIDPSVRELQARRLLAMSDTRLQFRRFVLEWLEVDELERTAKSTTLHPEYDGLKSRMLAETSAFVDEVMVAEGASVGGLLTAGFASVDPSLARFYGIKTWGPRASLAGTGRVGILQQASFLAAHSHEDSTSPVKRGDLVMRKILCNEVQRPAELGIEVVIPGPSDALTTRERFRAHVADKSCRGCHESIDALGYSFEGFDAAGRARTTENGKPVNTVTDSTLLGDTPPVRLRDSADLSRALAADPATRPCFARQAFRYFSAQHDKGVEASYLELRKALPAELSGNLVEELVLYAKSDLFVRREVRGP
jgi:hypothetical protein